MKTTIIYKFDPIQILKTLMYGNQPYYFIIGVLGFGPFILVAKHLEMNMTELLLSSLLMLIISTALYMVYIEVFHSRRVVARKKGEFVAYVLLGWLLSVCNYILAVMK